MKMNLPKFEDFTAKLTPDVMKEITNEINKGCLKNTSGSLDDMIRQTLTNAEIISYQMTIEILRRYHDYISAYISQ